MRQLRWMLLFLAALVPLATLIHKDDLGRWDVNRNAMAAPDEFSYLLLTQNLLHGQGISTLHTIGRDTFYPPGYPLLLAGWSLLAGFTIERVHLFNALLLCAATLVVYAFAKRLLTMLQTPDESGGGVERLRESSSGAINAWLALLIAGLFATNWHVLEGALFVFSEPAFMLTTFAWLALGLRWREWPTHLSQTLLLSLLAIFAWSVRGAGIVCIGAMLLFGTLSLLKNIRAGGGGQKRAWQRNLLSLALLLALVIVYQVVITKISPEKSLASVDSSDNSYMRQLVMGLTKNNTIHDLPTLAARAADLAMSHLDDYAMTFTPWFRQWPDWFFLEIISKSLGLLGLLGWLYRLFRRHSPTRLLELYILMYFALYLAWPFNMTRFWAPILPVMLVYVVDALRQFWALRPSRIAPLAAALLLSLLLILSGEELLQQLGNYGRRLNYVSDALAAAAQTVVRHSPDPQETIVAVAGLSEHFTFAWYLPHAKGGAGFLPRSPEPHLPSTGRRETLEHFLLRSLSELDADPRKKIFVISYFTEPDYSEIFTHLAQTSPQTLSRYRIHPIYQKEIITTVWEIERR